jgi:hypothetical protein
MRSSPAGPATEKGALLTAAVDRGRLDRMLRTVRIWTWDVGDRPVDMDGDRRLLTPILETILEGGLWKQFRKFPPDVIERLLPDLNVPPETRRLLEIWVEEAPARGA